MSNGGTGWPECKGCKVGQEEALLFQRLVQENQVISIFVHIETTLGRIHEVEVEYKNKTESIKDRVQVWVCCQYSMDCC